MDNNKKPSEPVEEERWALKEVNTMKNPLAVQILALSIQILALVVILLKKCRADRDADRKDQRLTGP